LLDEPSHNGTPPAPDESTLDHRHEHGAHEPGA
jgi:hypothetical protein